MPEIFDRVAVIGLGLMGGSLALALKKSRKTGLVTGYDTSEEVSREARKLGVADHVAGSAIEAASGAGLLFLATPTGSIPGCFMEVRDVLAPRAIVTDTGSAKMKVTAAIESSLPPGIRYVGGHPMTGSEQSGVQWARPDLYRQAFYILTPTGRTDAEAFQLLHGLLTDIGARVISMDPESHDRAMATVSHVPHLLSLLLMEMAESQRAQMKNLFAIAAGGFRDMTRIAASSPDIWLDICMENTDFIIERLREYEARIGDMVCLLENRDSSGLMELFEAARRSRAELSLKSGQELDEMYDVSVAVPDEPGVISTVSTAVGALGVNIEDMGIVHPLESETGIMTLKIMGRRQALGVTGRLEELGYRASFRKA